MNYIKIFQYLQILFVMMMFSVFSTKVADIRSATIELGTDFDYMNNTIATNSDFYQLYLLRVVNNKLIGSIEGIPNGKVYYYFEAMNDENVSLYTSQPGDYFTITPNKSTKISITLLAVDISDNVNYVLEDKPPIILSISVSPRSIFEEEEVSVNVKVTDFYSYGGLNYTISDNSDDKLVNTINVDKCKGNAYIGNGEIDYCELTYKASKNDTEGVKTIELITFDGNSTLNTTAEIKFNIQTSGSTRFNVDFDNPPVIQLFERDFEKHQPDGVNFKIKVTDDNELSYVKLNITSANLTNFVDTFLLC